MYRILLVNMPFANLVSPSIALTQLKSITESRFAGRVSIDIIYPGHDFAKYIGVDVYNYIANSMQALYAGLGDWFFRKAAFPELPDNTESYLRRFFWHQSQEAQRVKELIASKRPSLDAYLEQLIERNKLDRYQMVGFTSMFMQNVPSFALARSLKRSNPEIVTVMGGANCEFPMGRVIAERVEQIDFVFSGPALKGFPDFVGCWLDGDPSQCGSVRGILPKKRPSTADSATIGDELSIDTPIDLNYEEFVLRFERDFGDIGMKPVLPIETSRGCWWGQRSHCTFCGLNGGSMAYRAMKPELAIRQFKSLFGYAGRVHRLEAVDNILPKSYLQEVLPYLEAPPNLEIFYEVKADLSAQDIQILEKAGVKLIQPGIEALATSTLKLMKKGTTSFQNINFLKNCAFFDVKPIWNLLVGFPGESAEVYRRYLETIPHLYHLKPPNGAFPVRFDRFSPYFNQAGKYGLDLHPMDFYSFIYPFSEIDLLDLAYYFADRNVLAEYSKTMSEWIYRLQAAVTQWQRRWATAKQTTPPRLYFKDEGVVYDSRSGAVVEHQVGKSGKAILDVLSRPVWREELPRLVAANDWDFAERLSFLEENGLVFAEGDRLLSLVLSNDQPGAQVMSASKANMVHKVQERQVEAQ
jgi:ribosomal peptide maturation radical SAM protein 1